MHITRCSYFIATILALVIAQSCDRFDPRRNKIAFQDSPDIVQDSIMSMRSYMETLIPREVNNFFFDHDGYLFINSVKMGRFNKGDSIPFIDSVQIETGFTYEKSMKFLSLSLFLRDNFIHSGYRHGVHGAYIFGYRRTFANDWNDQRDIVVETDLKKINASGSKEQYIILDQFGALVLLRLPPKK